MAEPGRFSLEKLVAELPLGPVTVVSALLALLAGLWLGRDAVSAIPELIETGYGYDAQLRTTVKNRSMGTDAIRVTFVDVDHAAMEDWGAATHTTPRDKLALLLGKLVDKKPAAIFMDFDLAGASPDRGDTNLHTYLSDYRADAPPLLLARELRPLRCPEGKCAKDACLAKTDDAGQSKPAETPASAPPTPFDDAIAGKPNILWVSSVFVPEEDGAVRSWRLWETVCSGGAPVIVPSPQLVAVALTGPSAPGRACLDDYLKSVAAEEGVGEASCQWPKNKDAREALIPFLIGGSAKTSDWLGTSEFRYQRVRASSLINDQVAPTAIANRIVVLGASYGPDKFKTPFGLMPGAALTANAIAVAPSILNNPPKHFAVAIVTLILAVIYGLLAKLLRVIPAAVVIVAISYLWLSFANLWLNPADAATTVSMALIILGAFLATESLLEMLLDLYERGFKFAVLRRTGPHGAHKHETGSK